MAGTQRARWHHYPRPDLVFERDFDYAEGHEAVRAMLASEDPPTTGVVRQRLQAVGAIAKCRAQGIDLPRDGVIIGFDDPAIAEYALQLTTIRGAAGMRPLGRAAGCILEFEVTSSKRDSWRRARRGPVVLRTALV